MAENDLPNCVGFIGLGVMGLPMAQNLAKKLPLEAVLHIYDIQDDAMKKLSDEFGNNRVKQCNNPAEVAKATTTVITMLPEGSHVREVYLSSNGILSALTKSNSHTLIDSSTIDVATSSAVSKELSTNYPSCSFTDAPVSGGVLGARAGTLTFMVGVAPSHPSFSLVKKLLDLMGSNVLACGAPTFGLVAKLCNNYCSGLIAIATSEAFNIAISQGMDPRTLQKVFNSSLAQSVINDKWNPVPGLCPDAPASKGYQGGFRVNLMRKDFALAKELGESGGVELRLADEGLSIYKEAEQDENCRGLDSRVVFRYLGGDEKWMERFDKEL